jgi:hypothetical protein
MIASKRAQEQLKDLDNIVIVPLNFKGPKTISALGAVIHKLIRAAGAGANVVLGRSTSSRGSSSHGSKSHRSRSGSVGKDKSKKDKRKKTLSRGELCRDFEKGRCTRGAGCSYSHSKDAKRKSSRERALARGERAKTPPRQRTASPVYKSKKPCNLFAAGKCHYCKNCRLVHPDTAAPSPVQYFEKAKKEETPDKFRRGDNCPAPEKE